MSPPAPGIFWEVIRARVSMIARPSSEAPRHEVDAAPAFDLAIATFSIRPASISWMWISSADSVFWIFLREPRPVLGERRVMIREG